MDKVVASLSAALDGIESGASLSVGGFGLCGIPSVLIAGLLAKGVTDLVNACSLPITGRGVAERIITDLCVFDLTDQGLVLRELAPGVTEEYVGARTEPDFIVDLS